MKKSLLFLLVFISVSAVSLAQFDPKIWYFGNYAGVDFNSGIPVALTNGKTATVEGTAVICDSAGKLLFYTDGITVWNKVQGVMSNGTGLHGGISSSQSALIVRLPGSDSLFYIFTTGEQGSYGFQYSIVDLSLQGGNGQVTVKNVSVLTNTTEQLTAALQPNGKDFWIIIHGTGNNNFYAYSFTAAGLNTSSPVISSVGTIEYTQIGYIRVSSDGKHMAMSNHLEYFFELYDFDKSTGKVSNAIYLGCPPVTLGPYGLEFSENNSLLYGAPFEPPTVLQWDISSGNAAQIIASQVTIGTASGTYGGALALAPDGNIYMAKYSTQFLSVINDPDIYGTGCNFVDNGFSVAPELSQAGLPNFLHLPVNLSPSAAFQPSDSMVCNSTCINFTDQSTGNPTSWEWSFPGGNPSSSTLQNPTNICYNTAGTYDVTLIVTNNNGSDTIVMSNTITVNVAPTVTVVQSNDTLYSSFGNSYQWYTGGNAINGATDDFYLPLTEDYYTIVITDTNGCTAADTIFFSLNPQTSFAASDTTICQKFCMDFFDQSGNNPTAWQWSFPGGIPSSSNLQNPTQICYNNPGVYDVTLITTNSFGKDTLVLTGYITVYSTPPFPTITVTGDILTSSYASTYQWQFNSTDIPGATNQSYTATQTGYYTVIITDENGCVSSATVYVEVTGIDNLSNDFGFSVYPNPSNGLFVVDFSDVDATGTDHITIDVVNSLGQKLYAVEKQKGSGPLKTEIDLATVSEGVYFIVAGIAGEFFRVKILVVH